MQEPVWNEYGNAQPCNTEAAIRIGEFVQISQIFVNFSETYRNIYFQYRVTGTMTVLNYQFATYLLSCMLFLKWLLTRFGGSGKLKTPLSEHLLSIP